MTGFVLERGGRLTLPGMIRGIAALWNRRMNLNLSASIEFIALFGVAMLNRARTLGNGAGALLHGIIRHGENSGQVRSASAAHRAVLLVWQAVHESGIFVGSATAGGMKRKVWACTLTSAIVGWIFGIWQPMHSLPAEPGA